jgi:hypothetical protein
MSSPLKAAYHLFWKRISEIWCHSSQIRYLPTLSDPVTQVLSIKFSPATGLFFFINGLCFPHWPTIDITSTSPKFYQRVLTETTTPLTSGNTSVTSSDSNSVIPSTVLNLPSTPFYNLFLQDMKYRVTQQRNDSTTAPHSIASIEVTDRLGWNGTGAMSFLLPSSSPVTTTFLEIPMQMQLKALESLTTVRLNYLCPEPSFQFSVRLSCEVTFPSSGLPEITPPPTTISLEVPYLIERKDNQSVPQVFCWVQGEKRIVSNVETMLLGRAQSTPTYFWADASFSPPGSLDASFSNDEFFWHQITFPVHSSEMIDLLKSISSDKLSGMMEIKIVNCFLSLETTTQTTLGFVLGSFELSSSSSPPSALSEEDNLLNQQTIELTNPRIEQLSGCHEDGRYASHLTAAHLMTIGSL